MHLFFVADAPTPYRLHFMQRMHAELAHVRLTTLFTHLRSNAPWALQPPPHLDVHQVGQGDHNLPLHAQLQRDWATASAVLRHVHAARDPVVLISSYNDLGRFRLVAHCHRAGIPVLIWVDSNARSDRARGLKRALKRAILSRLFARTDALLACGSLGREFLLRYGADPARIHLSPCEPDYAEIENLTPEEITQTAQTLQIQPHRRKLLYSGRLVPEKGVDQLLHAFTTLAHDVPDWDLLLAGDGPQRPHLEAAVPHELAGRIRFLGFIDNQRTLSALYRNADCLCLPSHYEPWALVINEAAAASLAIVASDVVGAAAELVRDNINGKVFPANDLPALTAALHAVLNSPRLDQMKSASRDVLADWRARADPIDGLRQALARVR